MVWESPDLLRRRFSAEVTEGELVADYSGIAACYDLLMRAGYYDHDALANAAHSVIGGRRRVLELGVGTGLFAQSLTERDVDYEITGVDCTASMLDIARDRLSAQTELVEADVIHMDLGATFETAISSGGVWVILDDDDDDFLLGTHLPTSAHDIGGLRNVRDHLESDGLLLLSIQPMHRDFELTLPEGIRYAQRVSEPEEPAEHFFVEKEYSFTRGSAVLGHETLRLGFYRGVSMEEVFEQAGFGFEGVDDEGRFFVFSPGAGAVTV